MTLPDPRIQACAKARAIAARAHSISHLGKQIAEIAEPENVKPEEWVEFSESLDALLKDLKNEIESFMQKADHAT